MVKDPVKLLDNGSAMGCDAAVNAAQGHPGLLFTAFEPSGDDHASAVIAELKRRHADLPIYAWGGRKMKAAGAELVAETGHDAVVGVPGWDKIKEHLRINREIRDWIRANDVKVHIPVDSPAANFPICKIAKRAGLKVVHLVAPQLWAWGPWRIGKLRRCTDLVLCLLPFEETWFREKGVEATFIGHPLFDEPIDTDALQREAEDLPRPTGGGLRLAILPGSRPAELRRNFPLLFRSFLALRESHPGLVGVVGATTQEAVDDMRARAAEHGEWPADLHVVIGETDLVAAWCDLALVVSGTVTLQLTRQAKPMVIVYKTNELTYKWVGRWVLTTDVFALPNLIAGRRIVPELIPYFTGTERLLETVNGVLTDPQALEQQRADLQDICEQFAGHNAARGAADAIERVAGLCSRPELCGAG